jgi:diadenosine tetraphosphatase ApaH/serine/threonine PP2A family protein phosphatase
VRYGILSDIHGNLEAFEAVLEALSHESIDVYLCLGDIVGYGASPNECLERVWSLTSEVIAGNHDHAATGKLDIVSFNHAAAEAALWTMQRLTRTGRHYLRELPLARRYDHILAVHAAPTHPEQWPYLISLDQAACEFQAFPEGIRVCVLGHTHTPAIFERDDEQDTCRLVPHNRCPLMATCRYIVNTGSVGQPRDGDPRAAYGVYDTEAMLVEIKRVPYDIQTAQKKIRRAGLPEVLAGRLARGR